MSAGAGDKMENRKQRTRVKNQTTRRLKMKNKGQLIEENRQRRLVMRKVTESTLTTNG